MHFRAGEGNETAMREAMALFGGSVDSSRRCKRVTVVLCAVAHLVVTLYVLSVYLGSSSQGSTSTPLSDCLRGSSPCRSLQGRKLIKLRKENRKVAIELRRQLAPLTLMLRVKDIEAEVAKGFQGQVAMNAEEKSEQEELQEQVELETEQQGPPAVEDDNLGAIQRLIPPEKCYPESNTDFGGVAVRWGLTYHVSNAGECCRACALQAAYAKAGQRKCNVWVFCPEKKGCSSPDGFEHKFGECWLKQADQPRAIVHDYSLVMQGRPGPPVPVLWISGVTPFNGG